MAKKQVTLHHYWDDGVTIELRNFPSKKAARKFVRDNGYINFVID